MPPKRPNDDSNADSGRSRKKARTAEARSINVQASTSKAAAMSVNSMQGLPGAIDVERFTEARAFEIRAMQESMASAAANATTRAFQSVPRHLRRRAASHDVRKLPVRLREKARAEMDAPKKKTKKKGAKGKSKVISRTEQFRKRQVDKTWLETHIYHAKRMHMVNKWGYRLAEQPTEKSFRPSIRAAASASILHDASYFATLQVKGLQNTLVQVLSRVVDPMGAGPSAVRFTSGARVCDTVAYELDAYPFGLIAPITVIWCPAEPSPAITADKSPTASKPHRTLWIRIHPSAFPSFLLNFQKAASLVLEEHSQALSAVEEGSKQEEELEVTDLRGEICAFELIGPKSTQVLRGALSTAKAEERKEFKEFWREMLSLQSPGSVPRGMVIGLEVYDPRLDFPPSTAKPNSKTAARDTFTCFPSINLSRTALWDEERRKAPRYKKSQLDDRRAKNLVPGTNLRPTAKDDRVPLMIIQRSVQHPHLVFNPTDSKTPPDTNDLHGWLVLFPRQWSMAFLPSLLHTGTRLGGLRERRYQAFESGVASFPWDWAGSAAFGEAWETWGTEERERWERTPPAKRTTWAVVGTRSPWRPDWEVVLGLATAAQIPEEEETIGTQPEASDAAATTPGLKPWLLRGQEVPSLVKSLLHPPNGSSPADILLEKINALRTKRLLPPSELAAGDVLRSALVYVRIIPCVRGCPDDLAAIYRIRGDEQKAWREHLTKRTTVDQEDAEQIESYIPDAQEIIGYVTTGNFSLQRGKGHAIGAVALSAFLELTKAEEDDEIHDFRLLVKVKDRNGVICRAATLEVVA